MIRQGRDRMRVAFLSYDHGEYCIRLASALARDADVQLLLARQIAEPHLAKLDPGVRFEPFEKPRLRQVVAQIRTVWALVRRIRRFQPDVIHFQQGQLWFNLALRLLAGFPLVVTVHDAQHHVGDKASQRVPQPILDLAYRQADAVIVHAPQLVDMIGTRLGIGRDRVHVIPHVLLGGDDIRPGASEDGCRVLFFGRIWPYKGLEYLIRAEPLISARVPEARIMIVGQGEDLTRYRRMMANPDHFEVINAEVSDEQRGEVFARAAVVVLPYVEASQSGVIPVAYSAGKPVVATRVGGLPAMVEDGITGYLVPPCDEKALAAAVVRMLEDPVRRHTMGQNGRRKIETECSPAVIADQLRAVYRKAIETRG